MNEKHNTADMVIKALRRARQLGQDYGQYSDSEYRSDWEKADATLDAFDQLVADTKAALTSNSGAQPAPSAPEFCPCCGNVMRACVMCTNEVCNAVTVTAGQAKYNKQHALARNASIAAAPKPEGE